MQLPGIYVEIRGDYTELEKNIKAAKQLVSQQATGMSDALNNALSPRKIQGSINSITNAFGTLNRASTVAGKSFDQIGVDLGGLRSVTGLTDKQFQKFQTRLLKTQTTNAQVNALRNLTRQLELSKKEVKALGRQFGLTNVQIQRVSDTKFGPHISGLGLLKSKWLGISAAATGAYLAASKFVDIGGNIYSAGMGAAQLDKAYAEIVGGASEASRELAFLRTIADDLGQNFWSLTDSYKGVLAASQNTNLAGKQTQEIFQAVTRAATTLGLSADRTKLTLYAVEQMMSKGKISAEELRRQMGDNLPGAFSLAAEAMGMTGQEFDKALKAGTIYAEDFLPKFAKALNQKYSGEVVEAVAATNKLAEAWQDLKVEVANAGFLDQAASTLGEITDNLKDPAVISGAGAVANLFGVMSRAAVSVPAEFLERVGQVKQLLSFVNPPAVADGTKWKTGTTSYKIIDSTDGYDKYAASTKGATVATAEFVRSGAMLENKIASINELLNELQGNNIFSTTDMWEGVFGSDYAKIEGGEDFRVLAEYVDAATFSLERFQSARLQAKYNASDILSGEADLFELDLGPQYAELSDSLADGMKDAFMGWGASWSSTLNDMVWDADASFSDILTSFAKMTTQMVIQKNILNNIFSESTFSGVSGWLSGLFGGSAVAHTGGTIGVDSLPRYHTGLKGDEFPAILQKGESVLTKGQMAAIGRGLNNNSSGRAVQYKIDAPITIEGNVDSADRVEEIRMACKATFYELVEKEKRYGGVLA